MKNKPTEFMRLLAAERKGKRPENIAGCCGAVLSLSCLGTLLASDIEVDRLGSNAAEILSDVGLTAGVGAIALALITQHYENRHGRAVQVRPEMETSAWEVIASRYAWDTAEEPMQTSEWLPGFDTEPPATEDSE